MEVVISRSNSGSNWKVKSTGCFYGLCARQAIREESRMTHLPEQEKGRVAID